MEDTASAELRVSDPLEQLPPADLQGRDLAEDLHHAEYPGLVRFLLLHGASWNEAQDAAQDAFTQMCRPGTSIGTPRRGYARWPGVPGYDNRCGKIPAKKFRTRRQHTGSLLRMPRNSGPRNGA